ncbi:MAG: alpha/beta hydrolase [Clostridia bacterium]
MGPTGRADEADEVRALLRHRKAVIESGTIASPEEDRAAIDAMFRSEPDPGLRIEETEIGGVHAYWIMPPDADVSRTLFYLHGGSYAAGGLETHQDVVGRLARAARGRALLLEYRLAPEHPFPAPVDDAARAYRALLDEGQDPRRLAVVGDSAGGGLALALMMVLRDAGDALPASAVLISPWTDLASTAPSLDTRRERDPWLVADAVPQEAAVYLAGADPQDPLASPLYGDLRGLPPLLIHVGDDEILLDDAVRIADKAERQGVPVTLKVWPEMWHVFHLFAGRVQQARTAIAEIGRFVQEVIPPSGRDPS